MGEQEGQESQEQEREEGSSSPFYSVRSLGQSIPGYWQVIED